MSDTNDPYRTSEGDTGRDGTWLVRAYRSDDPDEEMLTPVEDGPQPTVTFEGERVFGTMGLNRFTGHVEDGRVSPNIAVTRMAGSPELMAQEDKLLRNLADVDTIEIIADGMTMSREGLNLMELQRAGTGETSATS